VGKVVFSLPSPNPPSIF